MFKRIFLFMAVNIAVVATISIVTSILGVNHYVTSTGLDYNALLGFCLVWGMVGSFISLLISKFMAKMTMGVQIVDNDPQYAWLVRTVHQMAQAAGISKMPEVGVYEGHEVNAFATGPTKNNALVAVSTGLLQRMKQDEIEGVIGHEIAHIANGDMVTLALIQGVTNAFVMFFARVAAFAIQQAMRNSDDDRESSAGTGWAYHISVFVFEVLFGFLAMFIVAYFSRLREFRADKGGALYAGREKMINALKRLQLTYEGLETVPDNVKCMKISSKGSFMKYLSTHPGLEERIEALQRG